MKHLIERVLFIWFALNIRKSIIYNHFEKVFDVFNYLLDNKFIRFGSKGQFRNNQIGACGHLIFLMRFNCFGCMLRCDKILFMYAWGLGWVTTKQRCEL